MIEQKLLDRMRQIQTEIKDGLVDVPADSHHKYLQLVGQHQGIQRCIDELMHLLNGDDEN